MKNVHSITMIDLKYNTYDINTIIFRTFLDIYL